MRAGSAGPADARRPFNGKERGCAGPVPPMVVAADTMALVKCGPDSLLAVEAHMQDRPERVDLDRRLATGELLLKCGAEEYSIPPRPGPACHRAFAGSGVAAGGVGCGASQLGGRGHPQPRSPRGHGTERAHDFPAPDKAKTESG